MDWCSVGHAARLAAIAGREPRTRRYARRTGPRDCAEKGAEPGQLALAWLLNRRSFIVPLFGTRRGDRVASNAEAVSISLDADEIARIEAAVPPGAVRGASLPEFMEALKES